MWIFCYYNNKRKYLRNWAKRCLSFEYALFHVLVYIIISILVCIAVRHGGLADRTLAL